MGYTSVVFPFFGLSQTRSNPGPEAAIGGIAKESHKLG